MLKAALILILSLYGLANANATEKVINYDDFVHLSFSKQVETIQLVHSFLIEYEHQVKNASTSKKQTTKYNKYQKIMNFFINSAHADDAELFNIIPESLKCYYGGWISFMKPASNGKSYCVHPRKISDKTNLNYLAKVAKFKSRNDRKFKESPIYKFYIEKVHVKYKAFFYNKKTPSTNIGFDVTNNQVTLNKASENCSTGNSKSSITCNPDIYGLYKGTALCVKTKQSFGVNTSYLCSKALEHIKKTEPEEYKETMKGIISNGINSNSDFFDTLRAMYDTCLCGGDANRSKQVYFQDSISADYASRIFTSRTCAGILSQTQLINESFNQACNEDSAKFDNDKQRNWLKFLNKTNLVISNNINNMRSLWPNKVSLQKANRQTIKKLFIEDEKLFGALAKENFEMAKEFNLCPIMKSKPELIAKYDPVNKILSITPQGLAEDVDIQALEIAHTQDLEGETAASSKLQEISKDTMRAATAFKVHLFDVTPSPKDSMAQAFATHNGQPIQSNKVRIDGISVDKPGLALSFNGSDIVTLEMVGIPSSEKSKYKATEPKIQDADESFWQGYTEPTITLAKGENPEAHKRKYNTTTIGKEFKITSTLLLEGSEEPIASAEVTIPAGSGDSLELKNISYHITEEGQLYNVAGLNLSIKGQEPKANDAIKLENLTLNQPGSTFLKLESFPNYVLKTPQKEIEVKATYLEKGGSTPVISNPEKFGPPKLVCEMQKSISEGNLTLTIIPSLADGVQVPEIDLTKPEVMSELNVSYGEQTIVPAEGESNKVVIEEYDTETPLTALAKIKIGDVLSDLICAEEERPEDSEDPTPESSLASCEIKIENSPAEKGKTNLKYKVTYKDADGKNIEAPQDFKSKVVWYDHSKKPGSNKKDTPKSSRGMASEDEEAETEDNDEEKKKEPKFNEEITKLKESFSEHLGNGKGNSLNISQTRKDRKFSVAVIGEGAYKDKCQATASYTLEAKTFRVPNNNANFLKGPNTNMVRPGGSFMGGQR